MTTPALPSDSSTPSGDPTNAADDTDAVLRGFWDKYYQIILGGCSLVLLGIVAKGGWQYYATQRELGIEQEYAAVTSPAGLRTFAEAHPGHPLAGIAELRFADAAYATGQMTDALAGYATAAAMLKSGILAARAQLGLAVVKIQAGQVEDGAAALRLLADDPKQFSQVRAEAIYHLASLAAEAGRADEVRQLSVQLIQIDPNSPWTQRTFALQATLPPGATSASPAAGISFQPGK